MPAKRATSQDVAERAGVSRATVSHVLNGNGTRFPEETRARVRAAADALRYRPSPVGRALVSGRSDVVVLFMPDTTFGGNLQDLIGEVDRAARGRGLTVVVRFAGDDTVASLTALADLAPAAVVDLAALSDADRRTLEDIGIAVLPKLPVDAPRADEFDVEIGRIAAEQLLAAGPRRLLFAALSDPRTDPFGPFRYEGVRRVAAAHALPVPERVEVPLERHQAVVALREALLQPGPVAVACYNDAVAVAVLAAARALGLHVPTDVSMIGVDATELGQLVTPRLTSLRIDLRSVVARVIQDVQGLRGIPDPVDLPDVPLITVVAGETL